MQSGKQVQQLVGGLGVQGAGGLVGQQNAGIGDHGAGHSGALLLAAGDLIGVLFQQLFDAQLLRQRQQPPVHLRILLSRQHQGKIDVILQRKGVQQVEILKHKAQVVPPESGHITGFYGGNVISFQQHLAGGGSVQGGQDVQKGGFAGAGLAHDGDEFALLHGEGNGPQRLHLLPAEAGGVDLAQLVNLQNIHISCSLHGCLYNLIGTLRAFMGTKMVHKRGLWGQKSAKKFAAAEAA